MNKEIKINAIGKVIEKDHNFYIKLFEKYKKALTHIDGFSHLHVIWWGHLLDTADNRSIMETPKPYKKGPDILGIFGTRSPSRPNPILLTTIYVKKIDYTNGMIHTPYIDAENDSPVLDIKPYHPSERVKDCKVPDWCEHWPKWYEDAATFDWLGEFNF